VGDVAAGVIIAPGQGQLKVASFRRNNHTCDFRTRSFTHRQNRNIKTNLYYISAFKTIMSPSSKSKLRPFLMRPVTAPPMLNCNNLGHARALFSQCHLAITRYTSSPASHHTFPNQKHIKDVSKHGSVHMISRASSGVWSSMA
jgi:hypothetical protein